MEDTVVPQEGLRIRRPRGRQDADSTDQRGQTSSWSSIQAPILEALISEREPSVDSFVSAGDEAHEGAAAFRPSLPRWKQHFADEEVPFMARPAFLPPLPQDCGQVQVCNESASPLDDRPDGAVAEDELFSWLSMASGGEPEHVSRIVAWLGQLLHFSTIEELREEAEATMERLPEVTLVRVFAEASAGEEQTRQHLGLEAHVAPLPASALQSLGNVSHQRVALCLAALVAVADPESCEVLWSSAPPWALAALQAHPDDSAVQFFACAVLSGLGGWCRAWSLPMPQVDKAVLLLLGLLETAVDKTQGPRSGAAARMAIEGACRALAGLWKGTEDAHLHRRAQAVLARLVDLPSVGVPWAHSALRSLAQLGCGPGGHGRSASFGEVCDRLADLLRSSRDPTQLAAGIIALQSLLLQPEELQPACANEGPTGRALAAAIDAIRRFPEHTRLHSAGVALMTAALEDEAMLALVQNAPGGLDLLRTLQSEALPHLRDRIEELVHAGSV